MILATGEESTARVSQLLRVFFEKPHKWAYVTDRNNYSLIGWSTLRSQKVRTEMLIKVTENERMRLSVVELAL